MSAIINSYITFRYPNWLDYARHQCKVQHLEGWEDDLMNDIIEDLLKKPEPKIETMISATTRKIVNGRQTTELDKFVLAMIKRNACSKFASFRKNTIGQKIISSGAKNVEVAIFCELTAKADCEDKCTYSNAHAEKLDRMHSYNIRRLTDAGYPAKIIELYKLYFMHNQQLTAKQRDQINEIQDFLTTKQFTLCF